MSSVTVARVPIEALSTRCLICGEWFKPSGVDHIFVDFRTEELDLIVCPICFYRIAKLGAETGKLSWVKVWSERTQKDTM